MKLFTILIFLYAFPATFYAQVRLDIVCSAQKESVNEEFGYKNEYKDSLSIEKHLRDFLTELHSGGFLEASIDSLAYSSHNVTAYLHKGPQYKRIRVSLDQIDKQVIRLLNIRAGRYEREPLNFPTFRNLQNKILTHYENSGYPFATISLSGLQVNQDTITGSLVVMKNHYYNIDSIHINGDVPVKRKHLYRHIAIHPGDPYSEKSLIKVGERIRRTPYLNEIREAEVEFMSKSADLYLYIDRQQASSFSGILGIMPGGNDRTVKLAGELNLNLLNVFRRMERISLDWQNPGNHVQQMDLNLAQPYIFGRPFGIDLHLHLFRMDSTYMKVEAEAGVPLTLPEHGVMRVFGKTTATSLISSGPEKPYLNAPAAEVNGRIFGISYRHSIMDNIINPYRGWLVSASLGAGNKTVNPPPGYNYNEKKRKGFGEAVSQIEWFIPLSPASTIMLSNFSGIKLNIGSEKAYDHFFANELFLLGGINSIRGFDERSLAASAYSIQSLEYRYLFDTSGNIFIFFDGMLYNKKLPEKSIFDIPVGFGTGLTFNTPAGQFSISYALGRELGNPVSFRSSRVHMGIINRF